MNNQKNEYFQLFYGWSTEDVKKCLELKDNAGPVLVMVVNGIDILGGMCYGFDKNSSCRSMIFMQEKMGISSSLAEFVYKSVRCGMIHEGMPKIARLSFGFKGTEIFHRNSKGQYLHLSVEIFVNKYLQAIKKMHDDIDKACFYTPTTENLDKLFLNAIKDVPLEWIDDTVFQDNDNRSSSANMSSGSSENSYLNTSHSAEQE